MHFDPKKSREAHPQIGTRSCAAASSFSHQDSLGHPCDQRGSQLPTGERGAVGSQPVPFKLAPGGAVGRPLRPHRLANMAPVAKQFPRYAPPLIGGFAHRHYEIGERPASFAVKVLNVLTLAFVAAFIGAMLAIGHAF